MRKEIEAIAAKLSISTLELFQKAHDECRGLLWGLHGPKTMHELWSKGWCVAPPYVVTFVQKH